MPVGEHHDGFQMYDSELSEWNSAKMGPKRDILEELKKSIEDKGMAFSVSSHRAEHWWFFSGGRDFDSDVQDEKYRDFYGPAMPSPEDLFDVVASKPDEEFLDDWLARTCEMVDKYKPSIVYFDWWIQNCVEHTWNPSL